MQKSTSFKKHGQEPLNRYCMENVKYTNKKAKFAFQNYLFTVLFSASQKYTFQNSIRNLKFVCHIQNNIKKIKTIRKIKHYNKSFKFVPPPLAL